jgi:hypothetical protein
MPLFNYEALSGLVDQQVQVADSNGNCCKLIIHCVEETSPSNDKWHSFAVEYKAEQPVTLSQGNYTVIHPDIGEQTVFIIPKGPEHYETLVTCSR